MADCARPLVSVVIPAFNRVGVIERALDSVAAQTFTDFEILIVDDGSTDDFATVERYRCAAPIRLIQHAHNRGPAAARNTGIAAASGRFIAFLDSDDTWHPDKLAEQLAALRNAAPHIKACVTDYKLLKYNRELAVCQQLPLGSFKTKILFGCTVSPGTTLLVERSVFDEIGLFDEGLRRLEDWDWLLRFVEAYDILVVPKLLATVHASDWEDGRPAGKADVVLQSLHRIRAKHLPRFATWGGPQQRQFRSTLFLEAAARMFRRRRPLSAFGYVVGCFWVYPFRSITFFRNVWWATMSLLR